MSSWKKKKDLSCVHPVILASHFSQIGVWGKGEYCWSSDTLSSIASNGLPTLKLLDTCELHQVVRLL